MGELLPAGESSVCDIRAGDGNIAKPFFYSVSPPLPLPATSAIQFSYTSHDALSDFKELSVEFSYFLKCTGYW